MNDRGMSNDAIWVIDMFQLQISRLNSAMANKRMSRRQFDKYSYGAWAITETFLCIDESSNYQYMSVSKIIEILKMQLNEYKTLYERRPDIHVRYKYAYQMIDKLLSMTTAMYN